MIRQLTVDFNRVIEGLRGAVGRALKPSPLVSSLVLDDTRQHGPTCDGLSLQVSGIVRHDAAPDGRSCQTTQIYEGTNQIQRMVIAKKLFS